MDLMDSTERTARKEHAVPEVSPDLTVSREGREPLEHPDRLVEMERSESADPHHVTVSRVRPEISERKVSLVCPERRE